MRWAIWRCCWAVGNGKARLWKGRIARLVPGNDLENVETPAADGGVPPIFGLLGSPDVSSDTPRVGFAAATKEFRWGAQWGLWIILNHFETYLSDTTPFSYVWRIIK
jgi:hypothetical protein